MAASKYNYDLLRLEFITGEWLSFSDFCRHKNLPIRNGSVQIKTKTWVKQREKYQQKVSERAIQVALKRQTRDTSAYLLQEARTFQELLTAAKAVLAKSIKIIDGKQTVDLSPANVEALVRANDLIAKRLRVNIGLASDRTENGMTVNSIQDVIAKAYEQLSTRHLGASEQF